MEFEVFEANFMELIGEFQLMSLSETRLRDALRVESTRAEEAEASRSAALRSEAEARAGIAAASAAATNASTTLAKVHDDLTTTKMQLELTERQRQILEKRCTELTSELALLDKEVQQLRLVQSTHTNLQRQYQELQEQIRLTVEETKNETNNLKSELRRVERCAGGGNEIRERARLAAAANARERRLATAELHHTSKELLAANAEIARLTATISQLQRTKQPEYKDYIHRSDDSEALQLARENLQSERAGAAQLEKALAAALADNAELATRLRSVDDTPIPSSNYANSHVTSSASNALNSFLAE